MGVTAHGVTHPGPRASNEDAFLIDMSGGVFVVAVNRSGNENGRRHIGKSMIIDPVGAAVMEVAGVDDPQLLVQEIDLDAVVAAQRSLPWWRDRRPDLYKHLV